MKISKREKLLLGILVVCIILLGYFKYVYAKQRIKAENLKSEKFALVTRLSLAKAQINSIKSKESDIKVLNSKIQDKSILLYPTIVQEKIIIELDTLMNNSKINGTIGFSDISVQTIEVKKPEEKKKVASTLQPFADQYNAYFNKQSKTDEKSSGNTAKADNSKNTAEQMNVNLSFKGSYKNVTDFIKNIESSPKKIVITKMNLSQSGSDELSGSCELMFYAVPKISSEDEAYMKWNYNNSYGKPNPFDSGSAIKVDSTIEDASKVKKEAFDFVMSVRSINSDLPTIMLGRANDNTRNTYVYSDNNSKEAVEIYVTQKDNKYFYKYKTSRGSYPMQFNGDGEEFNPINGEIALKIYSNKRSGTDDKASADIKIYNKTDKVVRANIENDDNVNPRVNITGDGNSVDVKRN